MKTEHVKIGVNIPNDLMGNFNEVFRNRGYTFNSEAIRVAIRKFISDYERIYGIKGHHVGLASIIYKHTKDGFLDILVNIQYNYSHLIKLSVPIYFGLDSCLETIILDGNGEEIEKFVKDMKTLKGVEFCELSTIPISK